MSHDLKYFLDFRYVCPSDCYRLVKNFIIRKLHVLGFFYIFQKIRTMIISRHFSDWACKNMVFFFFSWGCTESKNMHMSLCSGKRLIFKTQMTWWEYPWRDVLSSDTSTNWVATWDFQQCGMCDQQASDQPAHTRSLISDFANRLNILRVLSYWLSIICSF